MAQTGKTSRSARSRNFISLGFVALLVLVCLESCEALATGKRPIQNNNNSPNKKQKTNRVMEPAFANAGQRAGVEIWRIQDFKPVAYPKNEYGKFYTGDSYIVLVTKIKGNNEKSWDIHFWLGSETSQDEAGSAAILSVQLDDQLGGSPIQYREVQEHETQLFLSNFKNGVRYLPGGVSSGFTHVDPNAFEKRLFQIKGSRNIRVKQVTPNISSMNKGDCFILDVGRDIYVYVGTKSKRVERLKAIGAANQIRDQDHAGKSKVTIVDEFSPESDFTDFFTALGSGSASDVPDESVGGDDAQFEQTQQGAVTLYRVSDASGSLQITPISQRPLVSTSLDPNDCFILDSTDSNLFVWVGKKCTAKEKVEAMKKAENFLTSKNYPKWTQIQRIVQGAEPTAFTQYFKTWQGTGEVSHRLVRSASSQRWEPRLFHAQIHAKGDKFKVEQVIDYKQDDLNEDDIMLMDNGTEIYVWIGNGASAEEKRGSQKLATDYLKKLGDDEVPITVIKQGDEPNDFKGLFPSWNKNLWENVPSYKDMRQ